MCTLHLFYQVFDDTPVLFAGNRDEHLDRAWRGPETLCRAPRVYGPRDLVGGGTWVGINEAGVLVGLANHYGTLSAGPSLCSRGTVVLETLRHESAEEARRFAEWVAPACKAYTLLIADPARAYVVDHGTDGTFAYRLLPGCHVITNDRFRDPNDAKARRSVRRMKEIAELPGTPEIAELSVFLADHEVDSPEATPLCIHPREGGAGEVGEPSRFGTSSASVIGVRGDRRLRGYHFAPGPPCVTPFVDVTPDWDSGPSPRASRASESGEA